MPPTSEDSAALFTFDDLLVDFHDICAPSGGPIPETNDPYGLNCQENPPVSWLLPVHCYLFPEGCGSYCMKWGGPDMFSPITRTSDIFAFLACTIKGGPVDWLDMRLIVTNHKLAKCVLDLRFYISPIQSPPLGHLQQRMCAALSSCYDQMATGEVLVELVMWPQWSRQVDWPGVESSICREPR